MSGLPVAATEEVFYPDVAGLGRSMGEEEAEAVAPARPRWLGAFANRWPAILVPMGLLALQLTADEALLSLLEFDRSAIRAGELWRLITAHGVHVDALHALQNVLALAGLLAVAREPRRLLRALLIAMPLLGLALWWLAPGMQSLRGASGLLFAGLVWLLLLPHQCRWSIAAEWRNALWLVLACKLMADLMALLGVFPHEAGAGWVVAAEAHLLGAFIGWQLASAQRARPG
jgi:rhomboid family GlyGly-CTERM serine protease